LINGGFLQVKRQKLQFLKSLAWNIDPVRRSEDTARSALLGPCFFEPSGGTFTEQAKAGGNGEGRRTIQEQDFKAGNSQLRNKAVVSVVHSTSTWLEFKHL
jgi:hypothetical protein